MIEEKKRDGTFSDVKVVKRIEGNRVSYRYTFERPEDKLPPANGKLPPTAGQQPPATGQSLAESSQPAATSGEGSGVAQESVLALASLALKKGMTKPYLFEQAGVIFYTYAGP